MVTTMPTGLDEATIQEFNAGLRGRLLRPGDDGYDSARRVWNGMIDRKLALIARCAGVADVIGAWTDPSEHDRHVAWVRDFWTALRPYSHGVYVNELGNEGEDRVKEAYNPESYERLVALKNKYDPTNLFRLNQNIKPTV